MSLQSCPRNFIFTFVSPFIDAMIVIPYTETTIVIVSLVQKNKKWPEMYSRSQQANHNSK